MQRRGDEISISAASAFTGDDAGASSPHRVSMSARILRRRWRWLQHIFSSHSKLRMIALGSCSFLLVVFILSKSLIDSSADAVNSTNLGSQGRALKNVGSASLEGELEAQQPGEVVAADGMAAGMLRPAPVRPRAVRGRPAGHPDVIGNAGAAWGDIIPLNVTWNALGELSLEERGGYLSMIRSGGYALEPSSDRRHGIVGLGDDLKPFWTPGPLPPAELNMAMELRRGGGFNLRLSDATPLDRDILDSRHKQCKRLEYDTDSLPQASVIIVFYNEPFSTLMRSVHSVLNLTPPKLLKEIILVDDGGDLQWIKHSGSGELEKYVALLPKTKLIRLPVRKGIVGARMAGIRAAKAPIFVILDSHIEVQQGWLEPILQRIAEDKTRILMPQVDGMDPETLTYRDGGIGCTLGFLWKLIEHGYDPGDTSTPERRNAGPADFVSSPTMAGGLFAANQDFFLNDIGGYDEQFEYWGTENLELSFRLWQCGGRLECAPCSRVYHIFRKGGVGYSSPPHSTTKNKLRTLAVWMDEYADLAWRVIGKPNVDFGSYDELVNWRKEKQCKGFQWFLDNVNPESFVKSMPADVPRLGHVQNAKSGTCLDTGYSDYPGEAKFKLHSCHGGQTQDFMYFKNVQHIMPVGNDECCLQHGGTAGDTSWCHKGYNQWSMVPSGDYVQLRSVQSGNCLGQENDVLTYMKCDLDDEAQLWEWQKYDPPKVWTPPPRAANQ